MLKKITLYSILLCLSFKTLANEGMWLPLLLSQNEAEMKALGMKISAEDIYSVNKGSLKDAICQFGGGCTAELISKEGLLLTNHHCGYDAIQNHSSLEHNYLEDGFWAMSRGEEKQNAGLTAMFISRIEDVSAAALAGVTKEMSEKDRQSTIDKNLVALKKNAKREAWEDVFTRAFFDGNQYFLFVTETFRDVRLVGAPPSSIGKFGNDTDNWAYPRHTGDFSMFRIYADKNNHPAEYSADNVPYTPKHFLPISLDGVAEGDFTMVYGFPGRTQEYLPSMAVAQTLEKINPTRIDLRDKALKIMDVDMRANPDTKIKLSAKYASISNYWKKFRGENLGLVKSNGVGKKQIYEQAFLQNVATNPDWQRDYGNLLTDFKKVYADIEPYSVAQATHSELFLNTGVLGWVNQLDALVKAFDKKDDKAVAEKISALKEATPEFFKEYVLETDKKVFAALTATYWKNVLSVSMPEAFKSQATDFAQGEKLSEKLFKKTILTDENKLKVLLEKPADEIVKNLRKDKFYAFAKTLMENYDTKIAPKVTENQLIINQLRRQYTKAQMEVMAGKRVFYPDANSTLRVAYGQVKNFQPKDGVTYDAFTYLDGVMEKYIPKDYEFDVSKKLIDLYEKKDYGQYGVKGRMPVCFIATNHTTGGNSGSPAIDAYGNLIGLNFDRVWEGTMSDLNYDPTICRNIMMDARYLLFIIDKYAGAGHLIKEMKLVHPKSN
jgi:heat shock protein HspQ